MYQKVRANIGELEFMNSKAVEVIDKRYADLSLDFVKMKNLADDQARSLIKKVTGWMSKGQFALGTETYTLGDIIFTSVLTHL